MLEIFMNTEHKEESINIFIKRFKDIFNVIELHNILQKIDIDDEEENSEYLLSELLFNYPQLYYITVNKNKKEIINIFKKLNFKNSFLGDNSIESQQNKILVILDKYIKYNDVCIDVNTRRPNFPEYVSENIIKIFLQKQGIHCINDEKGDLLEISNNIKSKIQVKCFSSTGPISFGPNTKYSKMYILDSINFKEEKYKIYEILLSSNDESINNMSVNLTETFGEQSDEKRRPRILFDKIQKLLGSKCKLVFDGKLR